MIDAMPNISSKINWLLYLHTYIWCGVWTLSFLDDWTQIHYKWICPNIEIKDMGTNYVFNLDNLNF